MTVATAPGARSDLLRPTGVSSAAHVAAFVRRDFLTARSYRLAFVLDFASTASQVVLFFFLARLVDAAGLTFGEQLKGGYFAFAVIGLVMLRIIDTALRTFSVGLRGEQVRGTFEVLLTTPARLPALILGMSAYTLLYGTVTGALMFGIAMALGVQLSTGPLAVLAALVAFLGALVFFASIGVLVAAFVVVFKQGDSVVGVVSQMLALLGGVYFPVTLFPGPVQVLAQAFPFTWALDVLRAALLADEILYARLVPLTVVACLLLPCSLWVLAKAIDRARRAGSLAYY